MCDVGPIYCAGAARKKLVSARNAHDKVVAEFREAKDNPVRDGDRLYELQEKVETLRDKVDVMQNNYDATPAGQKELKKRLDEAEATGDTASAHVLTNTLKEARLRERANKIRRDYIKSNIVSMYREQLRDAFELKRDKPDLDPHEYQGRLNVLKHFGNRTYAAYCYINKAQLKKDYKEEVDKNGADSSNAKNYESMIRVASSPEARQVVKDHEEAARMHNKAIIHRAEREESNMRSDTDGAVSQWVSGLSAHRDDVSAELIANGGKARFRAVFDTEGNIVPARSITTQYGNSWGLMDPSDPKGSFTGFFSDSKATKPETAYKNNAKKGYRMGYVIAPGKVEYTDSPFGGIGSVYATVRPVDARFSSDDVIITDNGKRDY